MGRICSSVSPGTNVLTYTFQFYMSECDFDLQKGELLFIQLYKYEFRKRNRFHENNTRIECILNIQFLKTTAAH